MAQGQRKRAQREEGRHRREHGTQRQELTEREEREKRERLLQKIESDLLASHATLTELQEDLQAHAHEVAPPAGAEPPTSAPVVAVSEDAASVFSGVTARTLRFGETNIEEAAAPIVAVATGKSEPHTLLREIFGEQPWQVLLSDSAFEQLLCAGKAQQKSVLHILRGLASGHWPAEQREELGAHGPLKLRRAACGELAVLWGVDVEFSRERGVFVEVLQVWDLAHRSSCADAAAAVLREWQQSRRSFHGLREALQQQKLPKDVERRLPRVVPRDSLQDSDVFSVRKFFDLDAYMLQSVLGEDPGRSSLFRKRALPVADFQARGSRGGEGRALHHHWPQRLREDALLRLPHVLPTSAILATGRTGWGRPIAT